MIDQVIVCDAVKISGEFRRDFIARGRFDHAQPNILGQLLGHAMIAALPQKIPE